MNSERTAQLRARMVSMDKLWHLAVFGMLAGLLAGAVIVLFRLLIEGVQASFLPGGDVENYEALAWWWRVLLPLAGGLIIGLVFQWAATKYRAVGVVHVMERLAYHRAQLPIPNMLMQFFGAAVSIICGHSVGREGPAVHLGATAGSVIGRWFYLPNNSTRTLVACGVAAAISASFNTPLAGVIFAMEVVLMEYTLVGFLPVILAAVAATVLSHYFFGTEPAFTVPPMQLGTLYELPYVIMVGVVIGCLAALFCHSLIRFSSVAKERAIWQRMTLAGALTGVFALFVPQVMSLGYDTVNAAMLGEMAILGLFIIAIIKLFATTAGLGLGLPGGLIGPTLVIGACAGAAMGGVAGLIAPESVSSPGLYAMIGMGAMMGATLQAPLAALTALLELTANPNIILPGMLAIVSASLVSSQVFGTRSVFAMLAQARGLNYEDTPVAQALRRVSVLKAMDDVIVSSDSSMSLAEADWHLRSAPHWIVIQQAHKTEVMAAADLAAHVQSCLEQGQGDSYLVDLADIPAERFQAQAIDMRASLQEALEQLSDGDTEMLYVVHDISPEQKQILGVLSEEDIEQHYRYPSASK